jgi:hypothetical protein
LESDGISAPTALDVRGYYNFGPEGGDEIANAPGSEAMSEVLMGTSAATLAANGISQTETVAEWRANVAAKMGSAGNATVLTS